MEVPTEPGSSGIFGKESFSPSALDTGIAEQLRDVAAMIETGALKIKHFALTIDENGGQKLELHAE